MYNVSVMEPERYHRIKSLFGEALEREPDARSTFLREACGGDDSLASDVGRLLDRHREAGDFLASASLGPGQTVTLGEDPYLGMVLKDRYQIERMLGRGGFGVVYKGSDLHLHRKAVVVKILDQPGQRGAWFRKKFQQECEALARIQHPGVVGVLDQGETTEGAPYLVMDFIDGATLRSALRDGGMQLARCGLLLRQIGQALEAAHTRGVYHRDLKPSNILLRDLGAGQESAVIIDFGIATVKDSAAGHTQGTRVVGTYPYMAPEQISGHPEAASDIYALGAIAYEMTTGHRPFVNESPALLYAEQKAGLKAGPRRWRPEIPAAADREILRALSFEPTKRHARPSEFGDALAATLAVAGPKPPRFSRRTALAGSAAVVAATGGAIAFRSVWSSKPSGAASRSIDYSVRYLDGGVRLSFRSAQSGRLYLINEGPLPQAGRPLFNVLAILRLEAARTLTLPEGDHYFRFDHQKGREKVWVVWSSEPLPEMEALEKWRNDADQGRIGDPRSVEAIQEWLERHASKVDALESAGFTALRIAADPLVHRFEIERR